MQTNQNINFAIALNNDTLNPRELERITISLENELQEFFSDDKVIEHNNIKAIDPLTFAAISISVSPIILTKLLEFLHTWSLRRENRSIKIKIQLNKDQIVEFEGSETLSKKDVKEWLNVIKNSLLEDKKKN